MKTKGRFRVTLVQCIHGRNYLFRLSVMANDENDAKKKAEVGYPGYFAL